MNSSAVGGCQRGWITLLTPHDTKGEMRGLLLLESNQSPGPETDYIAALLRAQFAVLRRTPGLNLNKL